MGSAIVILTFDDMESANKALETLKSWQDEKLMDVGDAVVVVKDEKGKLKVKETHDFTTRRGAVYGGLAGVVVGTIVGGPIGGALLGAAAGAFAGKKIDMGISNDTIEMVSDSLEDASSAIFAQIKSGDMDLLAAGIRKSGGKLHELSISDDVQLDLEQVMLKGDIR